MQMRLRKRTSLDCKQYTTEDNKEWHYASPESDKLTRQKKRLLSPSIL
jgi:hypothetical protein